MRKSAEKKGVKVSDKVTGLGSPAYDFVNDEVLTDYSKKSSFLGHELGHRHYNKDKAKTIGDKIGKAAHKYYEKTGGARNHVVLSPAAGIIAGIHSGKKRAEKEAKGEKESKFNRHKSWAIPLAVQAPALLAEGMASKHGYKLLKKSGAGKEGLKKAKKELANALGTYMGLAGMNAGIGEVSRGISYKKYKKKNEKKKKKEED